MVTLKLTQLKLLKIGAVKKLTKDLKIGRLHCKRPELKQRLLAVSLSNFSVTKSSNNQLFSVELIKRHAVRPG